MGQRVISMDELRAFAKTYCYKQQRDRQVMAARFVWKYVDNPKIVSDMGFIQFLEFELEKT